jgi:hypothetical protein
MVNLYVITPTYVANPHVFPGGMKNGKLVCSTDNEKKFSAINGLSLKRRIAIWDLRPLWTGLNATRLSGVSGMKKSMNPNEWNVLGDFLESGDWGLSAIERFASVGLNAMPAGDSARCP